VEILNEVEAVVDVAATARVAGHEHHLQLGGDRRIEDECGGRVGRRTEHCHMEWLVRTMGEVDDRTRRVAVDGIVGRRHESVRPYDRRWSVGAGCGVVHAIDLAQTPLHSIPMRGGISSVIAGTSSRPTATASSSNGVRGVESHASRSAPKSGPGQYGAAVIASIRRRSDEANAQASANWSSIRWPRRCR